MEIKENTQTNISPKEFLRSRRPERFSDSIAQEVGKLDRPVLEYQLSTLNRRSMELAFEDFAKQLCEKVICPNLLAQTGPVAGGDGKVDSQTFPVTEQSKLLWYVGTNDNSNSERWAFAVSTQEDWKAKCRKDVRKIANTQRGYTKAFCITSTYAKAGQRSDLEDELSKETGMDVRILDVTWILDQVFTHGYEKMAIDALSIDVDWRREVTVGPNDYSKSQRLKELEEYIKNETNPSDISHHQLDNLLEIAVLSKELEKPIIETQGLFERSIKAAERFGTAYHQFDAHYQYAWAAYWWFEDMALFGEQIALCFQIAKKIDQAGQWRDTVSLIGLYASHTRRAKTESTLDIDSIIKQTKEELSNLASKDERPSNSLLARASLELLNLQSSQDAEQAASVFTSLQSIVKEGERLVGFPFNEIYDLVTELDDAFGGLEAYETLLDYLTESASTREGETRGARLWLKRGARRLESNAPYQAIKLIGKSLTSLYKKEAKKDLYAALNILSSSYMKVDLLWASRANLLLASSIVTDDFWKSGDLVAAQAYTYIRLARAELQLGRVNYALSWWHLALVTASQFEEEIISEKEYYSFDAFLSQSLLNISLEQLQQFKKLPDLLENYQLLVSRSMLLYALGHEELVEKEYELSLDKEYIDYLVMVRDLDLGSPTPEIFNFSDRYGNLSTSVMGCEINISFPIRTPLVELAESILSVIEGFFSTNIIDRVIAIEPRLDIEVSADDDDEISISHETNSSGSTLVMEVVCSSFTPDMLNISGQQITQKWLQNFILEVFTYLMRPMNIEETLESMIGEDRAIERSVSFGSCFVGLQNVMGNDAVKDIKNLLNQDSLKSYDIFRSENWDSNFPKAEEPSKAITEFKPGDGDAPEGLINHETLSHRNIKVQQIIKTRLWDRTVWKGIGFAMYPDGTPEMTLLYKDESAAEAIFSDLKKSLGKEDKANRLRISIIRNIDRKNPAHYRTCISENIAFSNAQTVQLACRLQTMTPNTKDSIEGFLKAYSRAGKYIVSHAPIKNGRMLEPSIKNRSRIMKFDLNIMEAWKIGRNDLEMMTIQEDDDPLIPDGVSNPPVLEVLKWKKSRK